MTLNSEGLEKAKEAIARSYVTYPDGSARTHISDWFDLDAQDAVDFGVMTEPKWHGHSDVRSDQQNAYIATVLGSGPLQVAISAYLSALPPVDGLEVVAELNRIIAEEAADFADAAGHAIEAGERTDLWDREVEVAVHTLSQASSVIAGLKAQLAETSRTALSIDGEAQEMSARISSLEEENKRLREALGNAERSFNNIRGAIESNQVVDKDAHGTAIRARDAARQALGDHNG